MENWLGSVRTNLTFTRNDLYRGSHRLVALQILPFGREAMSEAGIPSVSNILKKTDPQLGPASV